METILFYEWFLCPGFINIKYDEDKSTLGKRAINRATDTVNTTIAITIKNLCADHRNANKNNHENIVDKKRGNKGKGCLLNRLP